MRPPDELTPHQRSLVNTLLGIYAQGAFPMGEPGSDEVNFFTTPTRGIIPLDDLSVRPSRRLARTIRSGRFEFTSDTAFEAVIGKCALPRTADDETWITPPIVEWYELLHRAGHAHCIEAWRTNPDTEQRVLVGGIYGVSLGGAFFGESMFHTALPRLPDGSRDPFDGTDASKACFFLLAQHLRNCGFTLFDAQFPNEHINTLGCLTIDAADYEKRLHDAMEKQSSWERFDPKTVVSEITGI